jgi:mono/diheme cytochrome c family protein
MKQFIGISILVLFAACDMPLVVNPPKDQPTVCGNAIGGNDHGKELFMNNCASCHAMMKHMEGAALSGNFRQFWNNDTLAFVSYLRNSRKYLKSQPKSSWIVAEHKKFGNITHPSFPLSDSDIRDLIAYLQ